MLPVLAVAGLPLLPAFSVHGGWKHVCIRTHVSLDVYIYFSISPSQWFSTVALPLDIFVCNKLGAAAGFEWVESRDTANHSTIHRTAPTGNYLTQNVNNVEAEKPQIHFNISTVHSVCSSTTVHHWRVHLSFAPLLICNLVLQ